MATLTRILLVSTVITFHFPFALADWKCKSKLLSVSDQAKHLSITDNLKLYQAAESSDLKKYAKARFGELGTQLHARISSLDPLLLPLLLDPGVVFHYEEFEKYIKIRQKAKSLNSKLDPWKIRAEFARELGTKHVYRGMSLDPQAVKKIEEIGILSAYLRDYEKQSPKYQSEIFELNFIAFFANREASVILQYPDTPNIGRVDPLVSVTADPKIAREVAEWFKAPGNSVYLYEMEIPAIDLVAPDLAEADIESFVFLKILPQHVKSVTKVRE